MPKKRLFNLKNLGSWAGIKKKKKNNGDAAVPIVATGSDYIDKENVCHVLYGPETIYSPSLMDDRHVQMVSLLKRHIRLHLKLLESQYQTIFGIHPSDRYSSSQATVFLWMYS